MRNFKSQIQKATLDGFEFFIKRDDLLGDYLGGNKARKLEFFVKNAHNFGRNLRIISYGSSQSNTLAALSVFARINGFTLIFVCEKISNFLKQNPCGNYAFALQNGAQIVENSRFSSRREMALSLCEERDIFIEEGVACKEAQWGFKTLADEIKIQSKEMKRKFDIFLPAGTGASALYLAKFSEFRVFTCACVGDEGYLKRQMLALEPNFDIKIIDKKSDLREILSPIALNLPPFFAKKYPNLALNLLTFLQGTKNFFFELKNSLFRVKNSLLRVKNSPFQAKNLLENPANSPLCQKQKPQIFILKTPRKFHFAKPYKELLSIYQRALEQTGVEFSLLYDGVGLLVMLFYRDIFTHKVLYIHQGGTRGNASLLERYKFKHLL